jgi:hypothetical protein
MSDEFYIGYEGRVPPSARAQVAGAVAVALVGGLLVSAVIVLAQAPFATSSFAYGHPTPHRGVIRLDPYPSLDTGAERVLLVAPGKRGAEDVVRAFENQAVQLDGSVIEREGHRMLEVVAGSVRPLPGQTAAVSARLSDLGEARLDGEIVDGKCYLGVMNPGEGPVHRDCARACLRGGLPALFVVRTPDGRVVPFTLTSRAGASVSRAVAPFAGRPVSIRGRALVDPQANRWTLRADVQDIEVRR